MNVRIEYEPSPQPLSLSAEAQERIGYAFVVAVNAMNGLAFPTVSRETYISVLRDCPYVGVEPTEDGYWIAVGDDDEGTEGYIVRTTEGQLDLWM